MWYRKLLSFGAIYDCAFATFLFFLLYSYHTTLIFLLCGRFLTLAETANCLESFGISSTISIGRYLSLSISFDMWISSIITLAKSVLLANTTLKNTIMILCLTLLISLLLFICKSAHKIIFEIFGIHDTIGYFVEVTLYYATLDILYNTIDFCLGIVSII